MGKLRILGSGTSTGVPEIGCTCPVCTSTDPRDNRLRASSLLHTDDAVILIDCGPDFREQMLRASSFEKIDGVLVTHEHYDHVGGLDDLRPFGRFADIPIYSDAYTAAHLRARMPYCFVDKVYPGVPRIYLQEVEAGQVFHINRTEVLPLRVMHGRLPILGYRIGGRLGYITDMHMMPEGLGRFGNECFTAKAASYAPEYFGGVGGCRTYWCQRDLFHPYEPSCRASCRYRKAAATPCTLCLRWT